MLLSLLTGPLLALVPVAAQAQQKAVIRPDPDGRAILTFGNAAKSVAGWGTPHDDVSIESKPPPIGLVPSC